VSAALLPFARAVVQALRPLEAALTDPQRLRLLLRRLGYDPEVDSATLAALAWVSGLADVIDQAQALAETLDDADADIAAQTEQLIDLGRSALALIQDLDDASSIVTGGTAPPEFGDATFWADVATDLPQFLLVNYLEQYQPVVHGLLRLAGVIEDQVVAASGLRHEHERQAFVWSQLGSLATDPAGTLAERIGWGASDFDPQPLFEELAWILHRLHIKARRPAVHPQLIGTSSGKLIAETHPERYTLRGLAAPFLSGFGPWGSGYVDVGLLVYPAPKTPSSTTLDGLYFTVLADSGFSQSFGLGGDWRLTLSSDLSATGAVGVRVHPSETAFVGTTPSAEVAIALEGSPATPWRLLGASTGPRVELDSARLAVEMAPGSTAELRIAAELSGARVVLEPGEGDSFVRELLGESSTTLELDTSIVWSSRSGLTLGGEVGLSTLIPLDADLGIIHLDWIEAAVTASGDGLSLDAGVTGSVELGPVLVTVENVGLRFLLEPQADGTATGVFGNLRLALDFKPPDGVGLEIDAVVAQGGGFLSFDAEEGRYSGVITFSLPTLSITAIGLLTTTRPDGSDGWSLLISLSVEIPSVPLGFGFTLNGFGGIAGLNRTLDVSAIQSRLREGVLDTVLFPEDPIAQAPAIISACEAIFPEAPGRFVFGPMLRIGWGSPTLITGELAVLIDLPDPITIAVLGSLSAELPTEELAVVELHLDVLGAIALADAEVSLDGSLYDSRLVGLVLSGDFAVRAAFGSQPSFLVSLGGFHPEFEAPAGFPSLSRLRVGLDISDDIQLSLETYLALTSNTVQLGARAELEAESMGFTASGGAGFDVLVTFSPFGFKAAVDAHVTIKAKDVTLLGVWLEAVLTGPQPWHFLGTATFKVLGVPVDFRVEGSLGGSAAEPAPEAINVGELLVEALEDPACWSAATTTASALNAVTLATDTEGRWLRPDSVLEVRQRVVPLEIPIEVYGKHDVAGANEFSFTNPTLDGVALTALEDVTDWFAPGEYFELSDEERLSSPSFEELVCGTRLGSDEIETGAWIELTLGYEQIIVDPGVTPASTKLSGLWLMTGALLTQQLGKGSAAVARRGALGGLARFSGPASSYALKPTRWVVASTETAVSVGTTEQRLGRTAIEARLQLASALASAAPASLRIITVEEAAEVAA
jgi:hypothetical protein